MLAGWLELEPRDNPFKQVRGDEEEEAQVGGKEVDSSEPSTDESEDDVDLLSRANGSSRARQQRVIIEMTMTIDGTIGTLICQMRNHHTLARALKHTYTGTHKLGHTF